MSSSWFLVYDLDFADPSSFCQLNLSSATPWVRFTCLIVGLSAVNNHLDYRFIVFKNTKQSTEARKLCVRCDVINISPANICRPVRLFSSFLRWNDFQVVYRDKSCPAFWVDVKKNAILQQPNPRDQERVNRPCVALHVKKQPQIQWNCGSLLLAHPTYATECSTPEDTQDSPRGRCLNSSRSTARSESFNNPTLQCCAVFLT